MQKILESTLNKKVVKYLNSIPDCKALKRPGTENRKGHPDVTGSLCGRRLELEGKVGSNLPTKLQIKRLEEWKAAGAITGVYKSVQDVKTIIRNNIQRKYIVCNRYKQKKRVNLEVCIFKCNKKCKTFKEAIWI